MDDDDSSPIAQEERTSVALCFTLSGQTVHIGAAVRSLVRSADDEAAMRAAGDDRHKTHFLTLYELRDTLQLTDLDALLVREAPFFAFLPAASDGASSSVRDKIEKLLERHDVDVRTASVLKGAFRWPTSSSPGKRASVEATLASALGEESLSARDMTTLAPDERPLAAGALLALLHELGMHSSSAGAGSDDTTGLADHAGRYALQLGDLGRYMRLDTAAADAVMLVRDASQPMRGAGAGGGGTSSLFGVLNHCRTKVRRGRLRCASVATMFGQSAWCSHLAV